MSYLTKTRYDKDRNKINKNRLTEYIEINQGLVKVEPFLENDFICPTCQGNDAAFFFSANNGLPIRYAWCIPCKNPDILSKIEVNIKPNFTLEDEKHIAANKLNKLIERMENKEKVDLLEIDSAMVTLQVIDGNILHRDSDNRHKDFTKEKQ